jgi:prophage tail gpP-like protein
MLCVSDCVPQVQRIQHLRCGEDFVLLAKGETVQRGMIDRLNDIGTCYGMEKNVDKTTIRGRDCER